MNFKSVTDYIKDFKFTKLQKFIVWVFILLTIGAFYQKKKDKENKSDKFYINTVFEYGSMEDRMKYLLSDFSEDMVIGSNDAKVTIIEYYSYRCGYCRMFYEQIMPQIKENFINKGIVKFVYRPLYDRQTMNFGTILSCLHTDEDKKKANEDFFNIEPKYFSDFEKYLNEFIKNNKIIDEQSFKECIISKIVIDKIIYNQKKTSEVINLNQGVPLFIINGKIHRGYMEYEKFESLINESIRELEEKRDNVTKN